MNGLDYEAAAENFKRMHKCNLCSHTTRKLWDIKRHILRIHIKYGVIDELTPECYSVIYVPNDLNKLAAANPVAVPPRPSPTLPPRPSPTLPPRPSPTFGESSEKPPQPIIPEPKTIPQSLAELMSKPKSVLPNITVRELLNVPVNKRLRKCPLCPYSTPSKSHFDRHMNSSVHAKENQRQRELWMAENLMQRERWSAPSSSFQNRYATAPGCSSSMNDGSFVKIPSVPTQEELLDDLESAHPMSTTDLLLQMITASAGEALNENSSKQGTLESEEKAVASAEVLEDSGPPAAKKQALVADANNTDSVPVPVDASSIVPKAENLCTEMNGSIAPDKSSVMNGPITFSKSVVNGFDKPDLSSTFPPSAESDVIVLSDSEDEEQVGEGGGEYEVESNDSDDGYMRCTECTFATDKSFALIKHMVEKHQEINADTTNGYSKNDGKKTVLA